MLHGMNQCGGKDPNTITHSASVSLPRVATCDHEHRIKEASNQMRLAWQSSSIMRRLWLALSRRRRGCKLCLCLRGISFYRKFDGFYRGFRSQIILPGLQTQLPSVEMLKRAGKFYRIVFIAYPHKMEVCFLLITDMYTALSTGVTAGKTKPTQELTN